VHPRKESCSYLSSVVDVPTAQSLTIRVAAAGSFKLLWDGAVVAKQAEPHRAMLVDRAATRVQASVGDHLLTLKVCSAALQDSGRVRIRFTDAAGNPRPLASSSELSRLDARWQRLGRRPAAVSHQPVATLLERGVALTPNADSARVLAAAVARTLAGADDQRSPRAPGLLDRVVAAPELGHDALAVAGLISPFGANKSGWLTQAYERALAKGDHAAATFAQRGLVRWRLHAGLAELAKATLAKPPLQGAGDNHTRWLHALSKAQLGGSGLRRAALAELEAIVRQAGENTPLTVWRSIARLAVPHRPKLRLQALQQLAAATRGVRDANYLSAHRIDGATRLEQLARPLLSWQPDARGLHSIGNMLLRAGRYRAARDTFRSASELSPNRSAGFVGLARAAAALAAERGADEDKTRRTMTASLERARELLPQDAQLSAELAFRSGAGVGRQQSRDERFVVPAAEFLARAKAQPAAADGLFERQLHWRRVVTLHSDKRVSQLVHYAREIIVEPRTEAERYESLPFGGRHTELLFAKLHRPDGSVLPPEEQDANGPMVRWPKLHRGDVVEVALRSWTPGPIGRRGESPFYFVDYVGSIDTHPVLYNEVIIDAPAGSPLAFDVLNGRPDRHEKLREGDRVVERLIWDHPAAIADEPWSPRMSEVMPVVVGSAFGGWAAFLDWYEGAVQGFTEPDEQIKRLAEELTKGKTTREQKVRALFEFVADDIRYVNYVSGEWWLPNRPQQLLARRQGDCDDKAMLLISLLRAVGIDATEVLIQTRQTRQPSVLRSTKVAVPMFDHGIIFLPNADGHGGRYLDATSPQSRIGALPAMDGGGMALFVDGKHGGVVETPLGSAADHGTRGEWMLELRADGSGTLRAKEQHLGDAAFRLRTNLRQPDARAQWVESNLLAGWFPGVTMQPDVAFDGDADDGSATVSYEATSASLARREGDELVIEVAPPTPITPQLAPLTKRTLPVVLPPQLAPRIYRTRMEIRAPRDFLFTAPPPDAEHDAGPLGSARIRIERSADKRRVVVEREVRFEKATIPVAEYAKWRSWLQGIDRIMRLGIRLSPRKR
jgi:hypothetical protein